MAKAASPGTNALGEPSAPAVAKRVRAQKVATDAAYSRAFDNFVSDNPDDIEGLLGYALYKRSIRELCRSGGQTDGNLRNPPDAEVKVYRSAARAKIEEMLEVFELEAAEQWKQSHYDTRLETWKGEIKAMIRARTTTSGAVLSNMIAWVLTIAISLLVYFGFKSSSIEEQVAARVDAAIAQQDARPSVGDPG